jgi:hypothetical protein
MTARPEAEWWGMTRCFNAYSERQQRQMVVDGYLAYPWTPEIEDGCTNPPEVTIETRQDEYPGPRIYCRECAIEFLRR